MLLKQLKIGSLDNFTYLIANPLQRIGTVIDLGWGGEAADRLLEEAAADGIDIKYVVATHFHADHINGIGYLLEKTGAELLVHEDEEGSMCRLGYRPDIVVKHNDLLSLGGLTVRFFHTPGHSPGSLCLYSEDKLFTGDTLFVGGCGRADLPRSDPEALYHSLFNKILSLPEETLIYPGHDYGDAPFSSLKKELADNPYLRCKTLEEFLQLRMGR